MKNTYTIIDNFDKFDFSFVAGQLQEEGGTGNIIPISPGLSIKPLEPSSNYKTLGLGTYTETIHKTQQPGTSPDYMPIYNYSAPFMFGSTNRYAYAPDFRRYITGHRFFINYNTLQFMYASDIGPVHKFLYDDAGYKLLGGVLNDFFGSNAGPPIEGTEWFFDFLMFGHKLFLNNQMFGNHFFLPHIYDPGWNAPNPGGQWIPDGYLKTQYTHEAYQNYVNTIKSKPIPLALWQSPVPDSETGEMVRNQILFRIPLMEGSIKMKNWTEAIKYFPLHLPPPGTESALIELFEDNPIFRDLLKKMLMFRPWFDYEGIGVTKPNPPKHLYFVTDLEKGVDTDEHEEYKIDVPNLVKIESHYNYYEKNAEELSEGVTAEWQLPNLYTYYGLKSKGTTYYKELIRLGQPTVQVLVDDISVKKYYKIINTSHFHNTMLPSAVQGYAYPAEIDNVAIPYRYKNIVVGDKKFLEDANSLVAGKLFPMYNKITVPSRNSEFINILKKGKTLDTFMTVLASYFSNKCAPENKLHVFALHNGASKLSNTALQVLDLRDLMKEGFMENSAYAKYLRPGEGVRFGIDDPGFWQSVLAAAKLMLQFGTVDALDDMQPDNSISNYINLKSINNLAAQDWTWMTAGKKCYSEILAFEIAKFKMSPSGEKVHLQSVFLPATDDKSDEYFDTQVFYGHEYIYEIFTHSLVVGQRYRYNNHPIPTYNIEDKEYVNPPDQLELEPFPQETHPDQGLIHLPKTYGPETEVIVTTDPGEDEMFGTEDDITTTTYHPLWANKLPVNQEVHPIIVRAPYYNTDSLIADNKLLDEKETKKTTKVLDLPPMPPDIAFYPYKDNANKILISLNITYGERVLPTIPIFQEDTHKIQAQREHQKQFGMKWPHLKYKTEDGRNTFKVWRTTTKPNSWAAFNYHEDLSKTIDFMTDTGYEDFLHPNVDYYYFARAEDIHGNISTPTEIFHVRIVKEGGFPPYLVVKAHKFDDRIYQYEIPFKKYLKIDLKDGVRKLVDASKKVGEANYTFNKVDTGLKISPLKKYKLRVTSKKTGRKVDINLDFTKKISENYLNKTAEEPATLAEVELADEIIKAEGKINNPDDGPNC